VKRSVTMAMLASVAILAPSISTGHAAVPYSGFWTVLAPAMTPAGGWAPRGVALASGGTLRLAPSVPSVLCAPADVDGGAAVYDAAAGLCAGHDPDAPGAYHGYNYYSSFGMVQIRVDRSGATGAAATREFLIRLARTVNIFPGAK